MDLETDGGGGGAGGIGSGALEGTSTGTLTGDGNDSVELLLGFSGAVEVTVTPEVCLAMRGSLRVMVTEETAVVGAWAEGANMLISSW